MKLKLKIGILGCRGIPNAYGGFEQFAEYLSAALVERGHDVWVYNSHKHPYQYNVWKGVHIVHCIDWEYRLGAAGQFVYDYNCLTDARKRNFDVLLQLGYTSNSIWYMRWPKNSINLVNMDGLEWKRTQYNKMTRRFIKFAEALAAKHGDHLIADSLGIQNYLKEEYKKPSTYIPYGSYVFEPGDTAPLSTYNLKPNQYFLVIARMEPENNIEMLVQGYVESTKKYPLVIVSNAENDFGRYLRKKYKDEKIVYPGAIFHQPTINCLRSYSALYFHGHSVGGTNPSLLEAMGCYCHIAAHDNVFNKAILGDEAYYFSDAAGVAALLNKDDDAAIVSYRKNKNAEKVKTLYDWKKIIDDYEKLFLEVVNIKQAHG
ncbi:MAG: DUF1972 domain-containing protein [Flavisolibacter sp.]